jgi:hypothetical protein
VRAKNGEWSSIGWLGFICMHGTVQLPGRYCKIEALDVTRGDGFLGSEWVSLKKTEFVLGWLVESLRWGKGRFEFGVYGIVDDTCMPIVIDDTGRRSEKRTTRAAVINIGKASTKRVA